MTGKATVGADSAGGSEVCNGIPEQCDIKQAKSDRWTIIAPIMPNNSQQNVALRILHLEDSPEDHQLVLREFRQSDAPITITRVETLKAFESALQGADFDLVLADYRLPGFTALDAWQWMNERHIRLPFVLLSGAIGERAAVQAIHAGISDYLPKEELHKLHLVIERALEMHRVRIAKEQADAELAQSEKLLAEFAKHLQTTIEQERHAIAREIHDDIGGSLAAIRFDLAWIERHTGHDEVLGHIRSATDMLQHAVEASQRIMMNLRPAILDHGLVAAVHWLGNNFSKRTGIQAQIQTRSLPEKLPDNIKLAVFRTAQESLTNISKHAACTEVRIELTADTHFVTLEVSDNGQGIDASASAPAQQGQFGLKGLNERARSVGGWIDVSSTRGTGTTITLMIPLADGAAETGGTSS